MANVLYIDDVATAVEILIDDLKKDFNHTIEPISKASDVTAVKLKSSRYDLIILDIMMRRGTFPVLATDTQTGYAIYRLIRETISTIPIIVLSVIAEKSAPVGMLNDKLLVWRRKPILAPQLNAEITNIVSKSKKVTII